MRGRGLATTAETPLNLTATHLLLVVHIDGSIATVLVVLLILIVVCIVRLVEDLRTEIPCQGSKATSTPYAA